MVLARSARAAEMFIDELDGAFGAWTPSRLLMAVSYRASRDAFVSNPPRIFSKKTVGFGTTRSYDPAPDGKQVIALTAAESAPGRHDRLEFLLNFFDELHRRALATSK